MVCRSQRDHEKLTHYEAPVYPLTAAHVDALSQDVSFGFDTADKIVDAEIADESLAWLKDISRLKNGVVPFFATNLANTTVTRSKWKPRLQAMSQGRIQRIASTYRTLSCFCPKRCNLTDSGRV
ncbi:hypothetical protein FA95DRAFT_924888 [Auriscalpium vulgare]|uniref:Uncharacterized protein n=1 Tax=Auriscalpium vulgare TaxID=40419 RepID=A0ACB8RZB6_9AGAM|nr:hypothetical protein FA95DRAFT_924888 [Auriscalpium vulgare]